MWQQHLDKLFCWLGGRLYVGAMLQQKTTVECPTCSLSGIISDYELEVINLLKVDVERAELEVLGGIKSDDWGKIQQLVMEVHDVDGRLEHVKHLLTEHAAFATVVVSQSPNLQGSNLYTLYCLRQP